MDTCHIFSVTLFANELVAFVLRVVVVFQFTIGFELEIQKLMSVGPSMADTEVRQTCTSTA
jgi:hypothetical protein